jgi:biopolymer transport protein ExbD
MPRGSFAKNSKRKPEKLNITSLMDALTIILIFLLVNYSDVEEESDLPDYINLPSVYGKVSTAKMGIMVVVAKDKIQIGKERFVKFNNFESERDNVLLQVKDELKILKNEIEAKKKVSELIKVSIHADESIPYKTIDGIVNTAAELSLNYIDFIAMNKGAE